MLPKIKDFSPLLMADDPAGSERSSGLTKASSGVAAGLNIATMAKRLRPIGVDGDALRPRLAGDGGRGRRPVRRAGSVPQNVRRSLRLLVDGQGRRELRRTASPLDARATPEVALKEPIVA